MKNIHDVMRQKEMDFARLNEELEALRIVVPMLEEKERLRDIAASSAGPATYRAEPL